MTEIINTVTPEGILVVAALAKEIWEEHYTSLIGSDQVAYMIHKYQSPDNITKQINEEGYIYYTLLKDGEAIGYCGIRPDSIERTIFLSKIYIRKDYRGNGLSRLILDHFLNECGCEYSSVYLTVNKHNEQSIAAYRHLGFVITDSVVTDIGSGYVMDDYVMTKLL